MLLNITDGLVVDLIKSLSNDYYQFSYSLELKERGVYVGKVLIKRKDTGENVSGGCTKYGDNRESIEKEIFEAMCSHLPLFSSKPIDWNSSVRKILAKVVELRAAKINFGMLIESSIEKRDDNKQLCDMYFELSGKVFSDTKWIIREIEKLSADERKNLLTSSEEAYNDPMDPWNIDDLCTRDHVFHFFLNPSQDEIDCHNKHLERMSCNTPADEDEGDGELS